MHNLFKTKGGRFFSLVCTAMDPLPLLEGLLTGTGLWFIAYKSKLIEGLIKMEDKDLKLIYKLVSQDKEIKRLWDEHMDLEEKLKQFNTRHYLSTEDELRRKQMQKLKLQGKDAIEKILSGYRDKEE